MCHVGEGDLEPVTGPLHPSIWALNVVSQSLQLKHTGFWLLGYYDYLLSLNIIVTLQVI